MYREIFPQWRPAPDRPELSPGRVDIWRMDLPPRTDTVDSPPPHGSRGQVVDPARHLVRSILDDILARYLACPPDRLEIRVQPGGKPYLAAPGTDIQFNLSHCADMALVAVARGVAVGVDVEVERPIDNPLRLARRVFTAAEVAALEALPPSRHGGRFLELWTRMEARQKALGRGIFAEAVDPGTLTNVTFRPGPAHWASLSLSPRGPLPAFRFLDYGRT